MPPLFSCQDLSKSFGSKKLFQNLSLSLFSKERIGLIGPNGTGKSTLLKIIAGIEKADSGEIILSKGIKVGYVPQTCLFPDLSAQDILLKELEDDHSMPDYEKEVLVEIWLTKLGFQDHTALASELSGGWKKRLSMAKELITSPDLVLFDEPTNHLDLEGVLWLEKFLNREQITYLLVSHDRYFLENTVDKIIEIDPVYPGGIFSVSGSYRFFLEKKEAFIQGQLETERSLATSARREKEWLSRSPKARTTKSKSRVEEAHELFKELEDVRKRNQKRQTEIEFVASERETKKLLVAKSISKTMGERTLFKGLDFTLSPGSRMGLMGLNGSGKTTLLRLMADTLTPDSGTLKRADQLKIVYFDQHRRQLPDSMTLREALSPNSDFVNYHGKSIHVNGWCQRFLFSPDLLETPIGILSGGERARIAIAHLMLQPADLLLLDEPTNDLDIPTLEILEESLLEFPGAIVLITHDRFMLERICTTFLALGDPSETSLFASYRQWENSVAARLSPPKPKKEKPEKPQTTKRRLTHQEKKEYREIEKKIAGHEKTIQTLNQELEDPAISQDQKRLTNLCSAIALEETKIEQLYIRFLELDQLNT
jgi:ABC transport system ATP-binding/permease protein